MNPPDQPTPRTNAIAHRGYPEPSYIVEMTDLARTLERELVEARSERDLAITRVACILWSGAIDKHTCGDVQKWADYYTAELTRLRAEVERWKTVAAEMSQQREHNANEASRLRAEAELAAAVDGVIDGGNCREKMLYIHVPCDARGHMVGQPVKVILPATNAAMKGTL